jgi:hypothetical protein
MFDPQFEETAIILTCRLLGSRHVVAEQQEGHGEAFIPVFELA